jgi:hypothetical protein
MLYEVFGHRAGTDRRQLQAKCLARQKPVANKNGTKKIGA